MKYTVGLVAAVAAIGSSAQSFADLPDCGKTCVQGVLDKADTDLGCDSEDAGCLCANVNFTYGIRDCSLDACEDEAEAIINYGAEYCRNEGGVVITTASAGTNADATAATPGSDGSVPSETSAGNTESPATSGVVSTSDATSGTASGSPTGVDDSDDTAADEEGGVAHNTAAPAGLLAAAGFVAILV